MMIKEKLGKQCSDGKYLSSGLDCDLFRFGVTIIERRFGNKNFTLMSKIEIFLVYPRSSRDEIQTDFADNVFFQIKPRHSTQDDE